MQLEKASSRGAAKELGRYELVHELAGSGVASSWIAREDADGGPVLVTLLRVHKHLLKKSESAEAFIAEARPAEAISGDHVAPLFEIGSADGELFVVSEYREDEPLSSLVALAEGDGLTVRVGLRILHDALLGLEEAHAIDPDLAHGELGPHHIRVGTDGVARVAGFGVARALAKLGPHGVKSHDRLAYAAPERVKAMASPSPSAAAAPTTKSDLFSLGVMLWEISAHQRLFASKIEAAVVQKVLTAPVPPLASFDVPPAIDDVVVRLLERDPHRRLASPKEVLAALEPARDLMASTAEVAAAIEKLAGKAIASRRADLEAALGGALIPARKPASANREPSREISSVGSIASKLEPLLEKAAAAAPKADAPREPPTKIEPAKKIEAAKVEPQKNETKKGEANAEVESGWSVPPPAEPSAKSIDVSLDALSAPSVTKSIDVALEALTEVSSPAKSIDVALEGLSSSKQSISVDVSSFEAPIADAVAPKAPEVAAKRAAPKFEAAPVAKHEEPSAPLPPRSPRMGTLIGIPPVAAQAMRAPIRIEASKVEAQKVEPQKAEPQKVEAKRPREDAAKPGVVVAPTQGVPAPPTPAAAEAIDAQLGPGSILGRYEILAPIARGGMATVWAARQKGSRGFQKIVAIKTMLPGLSDDTDHESMFLDEASISARIKHPNVVEIHDLGEERGALYIVMEWIEGDSLAAIYKAAKPSGGVPLPIILRIAAQTLAGLHAAHELRDENGERYDLVHRDISPSNILVTTNGFAKVADFGIMKAKHRAHHTNAIDVVKGKTPFLSPEQATGGAAIDRRSDIFSFGITLYVLATGIHPFRGENDFKTIENIVSKQPLPLRNIDPGIVPDFESIVLKALAKDPKDRWKTAHEMRLAIEMVASSIGSPTDEHVAAFVKRVVGDAMSKRAIEIRAAINAIDGAQAAAANRAVAGDVHTPTAMSPAPSPIASSPTDVDVPLEVEDATIPVEASYMGPGSERVARAQDEAPEVEAPTTAIPSSRRPLDAVAAAPAMRAAAPPSAALIAPELQTPPSSQALAGPPTMVPPEAPSRKNAKIIVAVVLATCTVLTGVAVAMSSGKKSPADASSAAPSSAPVVSAPATTATETAASPSPPPAPSATSSVEAAENATPAPSSEEPKPGARFPQKPHGTFTAPIKKPPRTPKRFDPTHI